MRRGSFLLSAVAVVLLGSAILLTRPPAAAQEASPTPGLIGTAIHPVVGGWQFRNEFAGATFPSLGIVHADGTYTEVLPDNGVLVGVWEPTGERTALLTVYSHYLINDKLVNGEGRFILSVDASGTTMTETGTFVGVYENGDIDVAAEGRTTGTRLAVLPMAPLGTPVIPPDMTEATPPS
jgi:hypothetical protein